MEQGRIDRINELARLSKDRPLTNDEKEEQVNLRKEYIDSIRKNLRANLDSIRMLEKDGSTRKLRRKCGD